MKFTPTLLCVALLFGCGSQPDPTPRDQDPLTPEGEARSAELQQARRHLNAGELDEALLITDGLLEADPADRDARLLAAQGNIGMFQEGRRPAESFLQDAVRNLETSLDNDPEDPEALELLSWCQLKLGQFERGSESAREAAGYYRAQQLGREKIARAMLQAAECEMQILADVRTQEKASGQTRPGDASKDAAKKTLQALEVSKGVMRLPLAEVRTADVYLWLDRPTDAIQGLEDSIRVNPEVSDLHLKLQGLYFQMAMHAECESYYRSLLDELKGSGAVQWYLGRAQVARADNYRRKSQSAEATRTYLRARETYRSYDDQHRTEHANTAQWLAICELSLGRIAFDSGDLQQAADHYEAAWQATELVAQYDANGLPVIRDSFGGNYLGGLSMIGATYAEQSDKDALRRALAFWEQLIERHPDRFGIVYNNAALSARDLGVAVWNRARDGEEGATAEEAMELWEKSYAYYEKAVPLAPNDPRIINDCGLMLVYYLNRDYDRARELFERAIEVGQPQLDALDPTDDSEPTAARRQDLEEAIGDAYQNMGKMLLQNLEQPEEAKPWLQKALDYYPYQQREARIMLQRAERGDEAPVDPALARKFAERKQVADQHVAAGEIDLALDALDQAAAELKDYAPWNAMMGALTLQFTTERVASGNTSTFVTQGFEDAVRLLKRAVELDSEPLEPRLKLAEAQLAIPDPKAAAETADALILHAQSGGGTDAEMMLRIHAARGMAAAAAVPAIKTADSEADVDDLVRMGRASFREIEGSRALTDTELDQWINLERWAGAPEQALAIAQRAYERDAQQVARFQDLGAQLGLDQTVADALRESDDATVTWYRGRALYNVAVDRWSGGEADQAIAALDEASAGFERVIASNPGFKDSSEQWVAFCHGLKGSILRATGENAAAQTELLAAVSSRPDIARTDLGIGTNVRDELFRVGDAWFQAGDLEKACAVFAAAGEALPEDSTFANNHGLFARDYADQLSRAGDTEKAEPYYEASYAAYTRAQQLEPDNLRLRNDRALILVYHLKRDYETAEQLLRSVMADGDEQLQNSPPADADEKQNLEEAVGDAYGNLGYHFMANVERYADAKPLLEKAIDYYPYRRRAAVRRLEQVEQLLKDGE